MSAALKGPGTVNMPGPSRQVNEKGLDNCLLEWEESRMR